MPGLVPGTGATAVNKHSPCPRVLVDHGGETDLQLLDTGQGRILGTSYAGKEWTGQERTRVFILDGEPGKAYLQKEVKEGKE